MTQASTKFHCLPALHDPAADLWLLTGPNWAYFLQQALRQAEQSILLSLYLLSPHWGQERSSNTNLLKELCTAGERLATTGKTCRAVLGSPTQNKYTATYNLQAAYKLTMAGWTIRLMPAKWVLHEKIIILDDVLSIVGSHNISRSSATSNIDTSIAIHSEKIASELRASWWSRWNQAEPYRQPKWEEHGQGNQPRSSNRPTGPVQPTRRPGQHRII